MLGLVHVSAKSLDRARKQAEKFEEDLAQELRRKGEMLQDGIYSLLTAYY